MRVADAIGHALAVAGSMTWQIAWSLILGFTLSAIVQALVRRETVTRRLGSDTAGTVVLAAGLGAASSSCSYAAVALAAPCSARAPASPQRWSSRSPARTW
jgi:uncharacterized protein